MTDEEAEKASPLMQEAREMLKKWEAGDESVRSVWRMMNEWVYAGFDETYKRLGVDFDKIYYESNTYLEGKEKVLEGLEKGIMYRRDDGSVWADLTGAGLPYRQDDLCGGQRAELSLPGALAPARQARFQVGQGSRSLLLRHG